MRELPLRFEILAKPAQLAARSTWHDWARRQRVSPFAFPAFFEAWQHGFGDQCTGFVIAGLRGDDLQLMLPMWHPRESPDQWSSLGVYRADYTEAVTSAEDASIGFEFWRWLERRAPCRAAKIARFPIDSLLGRTAPSQPEGALGRAYQAASAFSISGGVRYLSTGSQQEHPYADQAQIRELAGRLDAKYIRRNIKMLSKTVEDVVYTVVRGARNIAALLPAFFEMHVANFAGTGRTSQFESPRDRTFYEALVASPDLADMIYMDLLTVTGRPVAMHLGFQHQQRIYYYKPTFDLTLAKAGPGKTLLAHVFARAMREQLQRIDLLKGTEPYKDEWANHSRRTVTSTLVRRRPREIVRDLTARWVGR